MITSNMRAAQEFSDHLFDAARGVIVWLTTEEARHAEEPRLRQLWRPQRWSDPHGRPSLSGIGEVGRQREAFTQRHPV